LAHNLIHTQIGWLDSSVLRQTPICIWLFWQGAAQGG